MQLENAPAVFAGNGFSLMCDKKGGKKHAGQTAKKNTIEGNVKAGTEKIRPTLKTTIWARR